MSPASVSKRLAELPQRYWFRILLIALLGLGLRLHALGVESLWRDEIASVAFARLPLTQLWSAWMVHETNPPLFYTLLHVWIRLFGEGEFAVRTLPALIGTAAVIGVGVLGRKLKSERAGEIAALFVALSALQVFFSQEARGYTLGAAAALLSLIAVTELASRLGEEAAPRPGLWLVYIGSTTAALYSHTTMVMLPLIANAYMAWAWFARGRRDRRFAALWIGANLACLVLWSWWGWITVQQVSSANPNISWIVFPPNRILLRTAEHLYGLRRSDRTMMTLSAVTAVLLAALAVAAIVRVRHPAKWLMAGAAFAVPSALLAVSHYRPVFMERTIFWTQGPFLILAAAGLASIPRLAARWVLTAVLAGLMLMDTIQSQQTAVKQPWREAVALIRTGWQDGDVVLVGNASTGVLIDHYCRRQGCSFPVLALHNPGDEMTWAPDLFHGRIVDRSRLWHEISRYHRVWVPAEPTFVPADALQLVAFKRTEKGLPYVAFEAENELLVSTWTPLPLAPGQSAPALDPRATPISHRER